MDLIAAPERVNLRRVSIAPIGTSLEEDRLARWSPTWTWTFADGRIHYSREGGNLPARDFDFTGYSRLPLTRAGVRNFRTDHPWVREACAD